MVLSLSFRPMDRCEYEETIETLHAQLDYLLAYTKVMNRTGEDCKAHWQRWELQTQERDKKWKLKKEVIQKFCNQTEELQQLDQILVHVRRLFGRDSQGVDDEILMDIQLLFNEDMDVAASKLDWVNIWGSNFTNKLDEDGARQVFDEMPERNLSWESKVKPIFEETWDSVASGLFVLRQDGEVMEAYHLFQKFPATNWCCGSKEWVSGWMLELKVFSSTILFGSNSYIHNSIFCCDLGLRCHGLVALRTGIGTNCMVLEFLVLGEKITTESNYCEIVMVDRGLELELEVVWFMEMVVTYVAFHGSSELLIFWINEMQDHGLPCFDYGWLWDDKHNSSCWRLQFEVLSTIFPHQIQYVLNLNVQWYAIDGFMVTWNVGNLKWPTGIGTSIGYQLGDSYCKNKVVVLIVVIKKINALEKSEWFVTDFDNFGKGLCQEKHYRLLSLLIGYICIGTCDSFKEIGSLWLMIGKKLEFDATSMEIGNKTNQSLQSQCQVGDSLEHTIWFWSISFTPTNREVVICKAWEVNVGYCLTVWIINVGIRMVALLQVQFHTRLVYPFSRVSSHRVVDYNNEAKCDIGKPNIIPLRVMESNDNVDEEFRQDEARIIRPMREPQSKEKKGSCYQCLKGSLFTEKEVCIVCDEKYGRYGMLRAMRSIPEGRKCVTYIGFSIDESKRGSLGYCSRMLKKNLKVRQMLKAEKLCEANQLPLEYVCVNRKSFCHEEMVVLQSFPNPSKKLKPENFWYDRVYGRWGKEGQKPFKIISSTLNVGGPIQADNNSGNSQAYINGREIKKVELRMLQFAGIQCAGNTHFWVNEDKLYCIVVLYSVGAVLIGYMQSQHFNNLEDKVGLMGKVME